MSSSKTDTKITMRLKIGYGLGSLGESVAYQAFYIYFIFFLTNIVGINPAIAGIISLIAVLWDAITDPLIGYLSDNSTNPKGRRRPFILRFCIPLGAMVFLLFTNVTFLSEGVKIAYFLIVNIVFWFFFTATDIPYISLGAELTSDYNERTNIRTFATMFYYLGMVLASSGTLILVNMFSDGNESKGWSRTALLYAFITIVSFIVAYAVTKGKEPQNSNVKTEVKAKVNFFKTYVETLKIKSYRFLLAYTLLYNAGGMLMTSVVIYFTTYNLGLIDSQIALVFLVYSLLVIGLSPVIGYFSNKTDKKKVILFTTGLLCAVSILFKWFIEWNLVYLYIYLVVAALPNSAFFVISYSIAYDLCDVDELTNGLRREGAIISMFSFFLKFATAIGMMLTGVLLELYGFNAEVFEQSARALDGIENAFILFPGILYLLTFIVFSKYPITKSKFEKIKIALNQKKNNEEYSTE